MYKHFFTQKLLVKKLKDFLYFNFIKMYYYNYYDYFNYLNKNQTKKKNLIQPQNQKCSNNDIYLQLLKQKILNEEYELHKDSYRQSNK